jgi:hypothetical protein
MTHDVEIGGGDDARLDDSFAQEYATARATQSEPIGSALEEAERASERAPLLAEEVQKRWGDSQAALREERRARQSESRRAAALEAELQSFRVRAPGPPDPRQHPQAALEYLHERMAEGDAAQQASNAQQREDFEVQALTRDFQHAEAEYREVTPDYDDAVQFLRDTRIGGLVNTGYDETAATRIFQQEVMEVLREVRAQGVDPARFAYVLAQHYGYDAGSRLPSAQRERRSGGELTYESVSALSGEAFDTAFKRLTVQERERERRS